MCPWGSRGGAMALLLGLVIGCTGQIGSPKPTPYDGPRNACENNKGCADGNICRPDLHLCVANDSPEGRTYAINVIPKIGPAQVFEVMVDETGRADAHIEAREEVPFDVRGGDEVFVNARVVVSDVGGTLPGRTPNMYSIDVFEPTSAPDRPPMGVMELLPGTHRYSIKVSPLGVARPQYPVAYYDEISVTQGADSGFVDKDGNPLYQLTLPSPNRTIHGEVKRGTQPVDGLNVEVIDPESERVLSTQAVTGCPDSAEPGRICGEFTLEHASELDTVSFRVSRPSELRYPTVLKLDRLNNTPPDREQSVTLDLSLLGTPVRYQASVENPVMLVGSDVPTYYGLEGCVVIFESDEVGGGTVAVVTVTDSSGKLDIDLFSGFYRITILPPDMFPGDQADYALLEAYRLIESGEESEKGSEAFLLSYRPKQPVRVTAHGAVIPESIAVTAPINHESPHARWNSSVAQADDSLLLWMDPGLHRMTTMLPYESGYAFDFREIFIDTTDEVGDQPPVQPASNIEAPIPVVVQLTLTADEASVAGAEVEWYEVVVGKSILVGRSTADANGKVVALLPQSVVGTQ